MEVSYSENSRQDSTTAEEVMRPRPWQAAGWIIIFALLHFLGIFLYIVGYSSYLGAQFETQGVAVDPAAIQAQVEAYVQTPGALVGMYMTQFALLLPVVLAVARFKGQPPWETLAFKPFSAKMGCLAFSVFLLFLVLEMAISQFFDIPPGEFLTSLAGTGHLMAALVVTFAAPFLEELVFRGYLFKAWRHSRLGLNGTLLLTSALFTSLHLGQYQWQQLSFLFVFALIMGWAREMSGSVLLPMLLHMVNNALFAVLVIYLGLV